MSCTILFYDKTISFSQNSSGATIFINSSVQNSVVSIIIYIPNISHFFISSALISTINTFNIFSTKLLTLNVVLTQFIQLSNTDPPGVQKLVTIFIDSKGAFNPLHCLASNNGQFLIKSITFKFYKLKSPGIFYILQ